MLFPYHVNHLTLNWLVPLHRTGIEFLARYFTVINLDLPGAGLSGTFNGKVSLDSLSKAVHAVREAVNVADIALVAMGAGALIACHYAKSYRENVRRIVFIAGGESHANRQLLHLRQEALDVETELRGALLGGFDDKRNARALTEVARASVGAQALSEWEHLLRQEELLTIARSVSQPALYIHAVADKLVPLSAAQALVDRLPNATLKIVSAQSGMQVWRDRNAVNEIIQFLGAGLELRPTLARQRSTRAGYPAGLSQREVDVLRLLGIGRTNQQIGEELFISLNTVSYHLRNIFAKTGASNRTEAAAFAFQTGIAPQQ